MHAVGPELVPPFVFFGHSMGALVAFEAARALAATGYPEPSALVVSGCAAPHLERPLIDSSGMTDSEFLDYLRSLDGTPEELLRSRSALELFLPMLRADFKLVDAYTFRPGAPLRARIAACAGSSDPYVSPAALDEWRSVTEAPFCSRILDGSHFYLQTQAHGLLAWMLKFLSRWLASPALP